MRVCVSFTLRSVRHRRRCNVIGGRGERGRRACRAKVSLGPIAGSCTDTDATGAAAAQVNADAPGNPEEELEDPDQPVFSLVSGKYRHAKRYGGKSISTGDTHSEFYMAVFFCFLP